jgi:hypothetical protein
VLFCGLGNYVDLRGLLGGAEGIRTDGHLELWDPDKVGNLMRVPTPVYTHENPARRSGGASSSTTVRIPSCTAYADRRTPVHAICLRGIDYSVRILFQFLGVGLLLLLMQEQRKAVAYLRTVPRWEVFLPIAFQKELTVSKSSGGERSPIRLTTQSSHMRPSKRRSAGLKGLAS